MKNFKLEIEIPYKNLNDIFITALEGGSNYWYLLDVKAMNIIKKYKGKYDPEIHGPSKEYFYGTSTEAILLAVKSGEKIPVNDAEEEDDILGYLSEEGIQKGLSALCTKLPEMIPYIVDSENNIADAGVADSIFQFIVLGEIVFG